MPARGREGWRAAAQAAEGWEDGGAGAFGEGGGFGTLGGGSRKEGRGRGRATNPSKPERAVAISSFEFLRPRPLARVSSALHSHLVWPFQTDVARTRSIKYS